MRAGDDATDLGDLEVDVIMGTRLRELFNDPLDAPIIKLPSCRHAYTCDTLDGIYRAAVDPSAPRENNGPPRCPACRYSCVFVTCNFCLFLFVLVVVFCISPLSAL